MGQFGGVNELSWPDQCFACAFDLGDAIIGQRDLGVSGAAAVDGPFSFAYCGQAIRKDIMSSRKLWGGLRDVRV